MTKRLIICLLIVLCLFSCASAEKIYQNPSTGYCAYYDDAANLVDDDAQRNEIQSMLTKLTDFCHASFVTDSGVTGKTVSRKGKEALAVSGHPGAVFLIDMENRTLWIEKTDTLNDLLSTADCDDITDNVFRYARTGEYGRAAKEALTQMYTVMNGQRIARPMKVICAALLAIMLSVLIVYAMLLRKRSAKVSKQKKDADRNVFCVVEATGATEYLKRKVYLGSSSSGSGHSGGGFSGGHHSGGGFSGGGHSGGGFSGGSHSSGGGHRF